jgi:quercetin dioxygenase-like cupin family protein
MLLPVLASSSMAAPQEQSKRLPSKVMKFEDLPAKVNATSKIRAVLDGETHSGVHIEVHVTELPPGQSPHAPHRHVHEEMFLLQAGLLDATIEGKTQRLTPGSVCYVNSNEEHGLHNPGPDRAEYFVVALGGES